MRADTGTPLLWKIFCDCAVHVAKSKIYVETGVTRDFDRMRSLAKKLVFLFMLIFDVYYGASFDPKRNAYLEQVYAF